MQCKNCQKEFIITVEDKKFYNKMEVPEPERCYLCRHQYRLSSGNMRTLYSRKCDLTGKDLISTYRPGFLFPVYNIKDWDSDKFDARDYGRDFNFSRPFFEQFFDLFKAVPRPHVGNIEETMVNSSYCNGVTNLKNCYLCFNALGLDDCLYSEGIFFSQNCVDCLFVDQGEICYECLDGKNLYGCFWCQDCGHCRDCFFCRDCVGCHDCFGCSELINAEHCFFNKQYSQEEYNKKITEFKPFTRQNLERIKMEAEKIHLACPHKFAHVKNNVSSIGDYLENNKNCQSCFNCYDCEDCSYSFSLGYGAKDCHDVTYWGEKAEFCYECMGAGRNVYGLFCCRDCWDGARNLYYSDTCYPSVTDCFGCVGLKRNRYCILNKQYTEGEYEELLPRLIAHLKKTGEWGRFFLQQFLPFGYNETRAMDIFPLQKDEALASGWKWQEDLPGTFGRETASLEDFQEAIVDVSKEVFKCQKCSRNYKIITQEVEFYKKYGVPLPDKCFNCRISEKFQKRPFYNLHHRQCMCDKPGHKHQGRCAVEFETTYAPDRPEKVYCEECYQKEIY